MEQNVRERILEEAVVLFKENGFDFRLDDLAKELHISKKTIYKYFDSKEDIFQVFIKESFDSVHQTQKEIFDDPTLSTREKLIRILNCRSRFEDELSIEKTMGLKDVYPELAQLILDTYKTEWGRVDALLEQGKKEGIFRKDVDNRVTEDLLMEAMQMMHRENVLNVTGLSYRDAIAQAVSLVLDGLTVRTK